MTVGSALVADQAIREIYERRAVTEPIALHQDRLRHRRRRVTGPEGSARREVLGHGTCWGSPGLLIPRGERVGVASLVLAVAAEGDEHERLIGGVDELPLQSGCDPDQVALPELVLLGLDQDRQSPAEDQKDLFLVVMEMDATALARAQDDFVQPERGDPEQAPQRDEPLVGVSVEACSGETLLHVSPGAGR